MAFRGCLSLLNRSYVPSCSYMVSRQIRWVHAALPTSPARGLSASVSLHGPKAQRWFSQQAGSAGSPGSGPDPGGSATTDDENPDNPIPRKPKLKINKLKYRALESSQIDNKIYDSLHQWEREIYIMHLTAVTKLQECYKDPITGAQVATKLQHLIRGECCGNGCRHCPYQHEKVPQDLKDSKNFNGAFYL